jgi:hypothetical protein
MLRGIARLLALRFFACYCQLARISSTMQATQKKCIEPLNEPRPNSFKETSHETIEPAPY